jgi:hypothetical protein
MNEGSVTTIEEMIFSGNEIQYTVIDDGESMQVRMKHTGTHEEAMEKILVDDEEDRDEDSKLSDDFGQLSEDEWEQKEEITVSEWEIQ